MVLARLVAGRRRKNIWGGLKSVISERKEFLSRESWKNFPLQKTRFSLLAPASGFAILSRVSLLTSQELLKEKVFRWLFFSSSIMFVSKSFTFGFEFPCIGAYNLHARKHFVVHCNSFSRLQIPATQWLCFLVLDDSYLSCLFHSKKCYSSCSCFVFVLIMFWSVCVLLVPLGRQETSFSLLFLYIFFVFLFMVEGWKSFVSDLIVFFFLVRVLWKNMDLVECQHLMVHRYLIEALVPLVRGMLLARCVRFLR